MKRQHHIEFVLRSILAVQALRPTVEVVLSQQPRDFKAREKGLFMLFRRVKKRATKSEIQLKTIPIHSLGS